MYLYKVEILKSFFVSLYIARYHATAYTPVIGVALLKQTHHNVHIF